MATAKVKLPPKLVDVFEPKRGAVDYRGMHGGRGSGKSFSAAEMAAIWGYQSPLRILCAREFHTSIKESFHSELKSAINSLPWLAQHYDVGVDYLRGRNGTEFLFKGLNRNSASVRSLSKIDLTIVEEAEDVPEKAWLDLEATVFRQPKSEVWAIWNPRLQGSPVDERLRINPPENSIIVEVNHYDNPFFPEKLDVLRRREQSRLDPQTYAHVWEGAYLENSDSQIFNGKIVVREFKTDDKKWHGPYYGLDWGFSQDPSAGVRCWTDDRNIYIDYEGGKVGLELDDTAEFFIKKLPGIERHIIRADSARPETISYVKRKGLPNCQPVKKWSGSVEDGIAHLRSYKNIVIHPRCRELIKEGRLYSYKVDRLTGDVLPIIVDSHNHYWDALRYAVAPLIQKRMAGFSGASVKNL